MHSAPGNADVPIWARRAEREAEPIDIDERFAATFDGIERNL